MIDLYFWPTGNGKKITIMLEECGLAYRVIPVNINQGDQFKPEFLAISPNNKMPAILDQDAEGGPLSIFESGAIGDIAAWPWVVRHDWQGQDLQDFPRVKRWFEAVGARPAVQRGAAVGKELMNFAQPMTDDEKKRLFNLRDEDLQRTPR